MPTKRSIPQVTSPSKLAHIVLRTTDLAPMASFYKTFLGGHATHENDFISFITYDDEHHRIAILASPLTTPKVQGSAGLEHIAFTFPTLDDLVAAYQERKAHGIEPLWCVNHGPTTSMYYCDPDGNQIETQVDNFDDVEEAGRFMASKEFMENPIGTDFEPEDLIKRLKSGESHASIKKRIEIGPRSLPPGM
ncbi:putative biphenyl-2,3-diol 1,2-dioxygenase III [Lepidopterella palustris CBS 459.81]|uniref:Putative biphenyl-2,3-diol 1,2-dioxygenase III n=1 Tax=Lepidopterella palustris CBS 459.81 TaxID=1314670 RepID=A0A8E2DX94_9PEZI|nr:putative biphenyl-2,3-diol 1,2-dioxygenase III [Lepidopterella palustris CBS 459.81]